MFDRALGRREGQSGSREASGSEGCYGEGRRVYRVYVCVCGEEKGAGEEEGESGEGECWKGDRRERRRSMLEGKSGERERRADVLSGGAIDPIHPSVHPSSVSDPMYPIESIRPVYPIQCIQFN